MFENPPTSESQHNPEFTSIEGCSIKPRDALEGGGVPIIDHEAFRDGVQNEVRFMNNNNSDREALRMREGIARGWMRDSLGMNSERGDLDAAKYFGVLRANFEKSQMGGSQDVPKDL